jgi:hypothetical protein
LEIAPMEALSTFPCMAERLWQQELEEFLGVRYRALCAPLGQPLPPTPLRIVPPLGFEEAKYFILGMEAGLFELDIDGYLQTSLLPSLETEGGNHEKCRIFWCDSPPPRLLREVISRFSTAAMLILDRGWLQRQIQVEPMIKEDGATAFGVEVVVKSLAGELLAGVVVKRSAYELAKLKTDFHQCCNRGEHPEDNCGFPQNHGKFEFCALYRPKYFWAVAPDAEICFKMDYGDDATIQLEEFSCLPPRSIVEMTTADS